MWYDEVEKKLPQENPFEFDFRLGQVEQLITSDSEQWFDAMNRVLPEWDVNTVKRVAGFISQCGHESAGFTRLEENLNYSWTALRRVFGSRYFPTNANARQYHRQPEKIANWVYMDRNRTSRGRLGNVYEGDGWLFRGRGLIQLTGRANYESFGNSVNMTPEEVVEYIQTPAGAIESACWYWQTRDLNESADAGDVEGMTRKINGGTHGLDDRLTRWNRAIHVLSN